MEDLRITLVQSALLWEEIQGNLDAFTAKLNAIEPGSTDLIILPEMFSTGFTMKAGKLAETMTGSAMQWLKAQAEKKQCVITGSLVIEENGKHYNRLTWMRPDGTYETYDKRHLFRMAKEHETYTPGENKLIVDVKGWKICPLVCYDLRFPVWSRNRNNYDVLIYVANWPEVRSYPWKQLLIARAIENQSYVAGINRIGLDGNNMSHSGDSVVIDPKGQTISTIKPFEDTTETVTLSYKELVSFREIFPAGMDADDFEIKE